MFSFLLVECCVCTLEFYTFCLCIYAMQILCVFHVITTQCYASTVYAVIVCLSIHLPHADIVSKWLNIEARKQCYMIAQGLCSFLISKVAVKF